MKKEESIAKELIGFIENSPSVYHVIENIKRNLLEIGYQELKEKEEWNIEADNGYFVVRNDSSLIAFYMPANQAKGFHIIAGHSDSPTFKVKEKAEIFVENKYVKLNTEKYGGMIHSSWLDRPLSVAGRIVVKTTKNKVETRLVNIDKDLLIIPNLAIHMNRDINKGYEYNAQIDLLPLMGIETEEKECFLTEVATAAKVKKEDIIGQDLFLYVREKGRILGANEELLLCPRLDDLQCVYTSWRAFAETKPKKYINMLAVFDNEEVGSTTSQGADSTFLQDVMERIAENEGWKKGTYCQKVAGSFLISADNAHAVHPNHPEKSDPTNRPYLGGGIVIKYHGGQKYTTDAVSAAHMKLLCEKSGVMYQTYTNRSDMAGGSTLGNISNAHVSLASIDIGLPQLAMHSAMETATVADTVAAIKLFHAFYKE